MKRFLAVLLTALLAFTVPAPAPLLAQADAERLVFIVLYANYNLNSASYIYGSSLGEGALSSSEKGLPGPARIKNGAATTDLTTFTASLNPFTAVAVGDIIQVSLNGIWEQRVVVTRTDANNIVIEKALDLNDTVGHEFRWRDVSFGTGAEDGWVRVERFKQFQVHFQISQMNATSIDYRLECQLEGPNQFSNFVASRNYAAAKADEDVVNAHFDRCRVGIKINTDDGDDTGANAEKIEVYFVGVI